MTPPPHVLCSGSGSQPGLGGITGRSSREVTFHHGDPFIWAKIFFFFSLRVSIISIATATARTAHRRRFGGTDEHVFKEHWERRNNCRRLAINWKLNLTVRGDVHK